MFVLHELHVKFPKAVPMRVVGASMEPTLQDRDGVLIDLASKPAFDDIVAVRFAERGYVIGRWQGARLAKDNPGFDSIPLTAADQVVGVCVAIIDRGAPRMGETRGVGR